LKVKNKKYKLNWAFEKELRSDFIAGYCTSDRFTKYKVDGWVICFFGTLVAIAFRDVRFYSRTDWTL
jgi:hypothetical protein